MFQIFGNLDINKKTQQQLSLFLSNTHHWETWRKPESQNDVCVLWETWRQTPASESDSFIKTKSSRVFLTYCPPLLLFPWIYQYHLIYILIKSQATIFQPNGFAYVPSSKCLQVNYLTAGSSPSDLCLPSLAIPSLEFLHTRLFRGESWSRDVCAGLSIRSLQ